MTDWQEKLTSKIQAVKAYIFPTWSLTGAKKETLSRWDELNLKEKILGYGEIDNHDFLKRYYGLSFRIFPINYAVSTIKTHLLLKEELSRDTKTARQQIIQAMKSCGAYVSQERWNKAKGFVFEISDAEQTAAIGEEINIGGGHAELRVKVPRKAKINIIRNGSRIETRKSAQIGITINEGGVYRVEVLQKIFGFYKPWIYSNPIWVNKK
jgi:hypothetical protein